MFYFVVKHLRWLARIPGAAHLFDASLVAFTHAFLRRRAVAMAALESEALALQGVRLKPHKYGGIEFINASGDELGHLHGHGLLDVPVGVQAARTLAPHGGVRPHHVLPNSKWISFQLESKADVPFALALLTGAEGAKIQSPNI
jgi:hypothetical protein